VPDTPRKPLPLRLRAPQTEDCAAFLRAVSRSRRLHAGRVSPPDTRALYRTWLERIADGSYYGHLLLDTEGELLGVVNLSEVIRGGYQSAYLGYYVFAGYECQGVMSSGLRMVLPRAFGEYRLHRVEAAVQPGNIASRRLVQHLGFRLEGLSLRSVKIGGRWRDHERWALTTEEWRASAAHRRKTDGRN
jgi:ribosomal-protein-alanine N-acetyltransferase